MERNKSKKLHSSFNNGIYKSKNTHKPQTSKTKIHSLHINYDSIQRQKNESFLGRVDDSTHKKTNSRSSRNLLIEKDLKGWKVGSTPSGAPLSSRILKDIINHTQLSKKLHNQQNRPQNKQDQNTTNNPIIEEFSPLNQRLKQNDQQIGQFLVHNVSEQGEGKDVSPQKQQLIIKLDECNIRNQKYNREYPELVHHWDALIVILNQIDSITSRISSQTSKILILQTQNSQDKTKLFYFNRDMLTKRKININSIKEKKSNLLEQAQQIHEELRKKIMSKADFQHIVLFNQKVILSGQPHSSFFDVYEQMFEGKLTKKFNLIVKKELHKLNQFESKLVQEYLKKIQELQNQYHKRDENLEKNQHSFDEEYFIKLEKIVDSIQERVLKIENTKVLLNQLEEKQDKLKKEKQRYQLLIDQQIENLSLKVSGQYMQLEGKAFNFKKIIEQKYNKIFEDYSCLQKQKLSLQVQIKGKRQN